MLSLPWFGSQDAASLPTHPRRRLLGTRVDALSRAEAVAAILARAVGGRSALVCACNVDMLVHGRRNPDFAAVLADADLVLPDGMPLVWMLRAFGLGRSERVAGPDLMLELCAAAAARRVPVGFYGGRQEVLQRCADRLVERFPGLQVAIALSPPFRPLSPEEEACIRDEILASGARLLFVALGCPKQERWMHRHRPMLPFPMIGVGAAVDFHAGAVRRAPFWVQRAGLEWLYRLAAEPRRLWRRYLVGNLLFLLFLVDQLVRSRMPRPAAGRP